MEEYREEDTVAVGRMIQEGERKSKKVPCDICYSNFSIDKDHVLVALVFDGAHMGEGYLAPKFNKLVPLSSKCLSLLY